MSFTNAKEELDEKATIIRQTLEEIRPLLKDLRDAAGDLMASCTPDDCCTDLWQMENINRKLMDKIVDIASEIRRADSLLTPHLPLGAQGEEFLQ